MSLINDALKRAQEAQQPNNSPSVASLRSIETRPAGRSMFSRILVAVIFLLLAAGLAFVGLAMTGRLAKTKIAAPQAATPAHPVEKPVEAKPIETAVATVAPVTVAPPVVAVAPVEPVAPAPTAAPVLTPVVTQALAPTPAPVPALVAVIVAPPATPLVLPDTLHVQGIAQEAARPWAIISGRTYYVGDTVKGVQVVAITRDSVTFGKNGQTNLLFLGQ